MMDDKSFDMINRARKSLSGLGTFSHRAMFGGYALAIQDVVFAMVSGGHLYLRACCDNAAYFEQRHLPSLNFYKRGRRITLNYFLVDTNLWEDIPNLIRLATAALSSARQVKMMRRNVLRLKDLPNLTLKIEVQLYQAGICDISTFKAQGSRACWLKMRAHNSAIGVRSLLALEGAIMGIHADALSAQTRQELLTWVKGVIGRRSD